MTKESIGARLKKARLEKGLTLEDVHKITKIHLNILKAIEEDNFINLNPIYLKGFLKIYCRLLGLDPRGIIPDFREVNTEVKLGQKIAVGKKKSFNFTRLLPRLKIKQVLFGLGVIVLALGVFNFIKFLSYRHKEKALYSKQGSVAVTAVKAQAPSTNGIKLGIHARGNCYVNLKTDGKTVFYGVLKKGRSENWQAKEKIEFSLGNAGVVDLQVNGKMISSLGKNGQAVKNVVITRDGLSVKK